MQFHLYDSQKIIDFVSNLFILSKCKLMTWRYSSKRQVYIILKEAAIRIVIRVISRAKYLEHLQTNYLLWIWVYRWREWVTKKKMRHMLQEFVTKLFYIIIRLFVLLLVKIIKVLSTRDSFIQQINTFISQEFNLFWYFFFIRNLYVW